MADSTSSAPAAPKRRRWPRIVGMIVLIFILLLVAAYFVGTSSAFFKGVILPKVSAALNAKVTVSDASISPFKQVVLHNLKVETTGPEPLLTASEVSLHYSLMDIMRGNIHVDDITLATPTVNLVQNPDGSSNLDPITKSQKPKPTPSQPAKPSKPAQIDIRKVAFTDGTIRQIKVYDGNHRDVTEIAHLNFSVEGVKNGQSGKATIAANIAMQNNPPAPTANGLLQAKLDGNFTFALTPDLQPGSIQGGLHFAVSQAEGELAQAGGLGANLDCNVTPTEIKQVALRFQKGDTQLGELLVNGPFDSSKTEGRLTISLLNIDKNLLNLAGASSGVDFGPTKINSTNQIQLAKSGAAITLNGQFNLNDLQLTRTNQTTPLLGLHADYDLSVDKAASNLVVRALNLNGTEKGNTFLKGELTSPMSLSWGNTANAIGDSALKVTITHFNLANWKAFLGDSASAGDVNATLQLQSQQAGKRLGFDVSSEVDNLTAGAGSNQLSQLTVVLQLRGQAQDLKQFNFPALKFQVNRQDQSLVSITGSGTYDQANQGADLQIDGQVMLVSVLRALPRPDMKLNSGSAELKVHVTQNQKNQNVTGSFALTDLSGQIGSNVFRSFGTTADLEVGMTPSEIQIRKFSGKISEGQNAGGSFDVHGTVLTNKSAQITAVLADFNQNGLRPFLEPMLADKKLTSVALNANAAVQYDPEGASSIKGSLQVTNLVVKDPKGQFPAAPLGAQMLIDAALNKQVADLRQAQLALTPTARATNQIQLTGHIDMTQSNATTGNIKLVADSLDLTTYYDLFGGQKQNTSPAKPAQEETSHPASSAPASAAPEQEPPAKQLPLKNFTADASIQRLYLHEVEITNFQTTVKIDGGHVVMNPFQLGLNGAPVKSGIDVDLGVPGYKYDVSFNAQAVPLAPLVDSFEPDRKGILSGTLTAQAKVNGTGTTGASLQKNLTAQFDMSSTNLNLSVDSIQGKSASTRLLKFLIDTISTIPELAKNPSSGASSLLSSILSSKSGAGQNGSLSGDLKRSPINSIILRGNAGSGNMQLQQALIQSPAFQAQATGTVALAPVLTNSTIQVPVSIWLDRNVAQRINMAGNTPTNSQYAKLPDFLTMTGTIGEPKRSINYAALGGTLLQGIGGTAGQTGSALQNLLGHGSSGNSASANTNQSGVGGLLHGLTGALGGGTSSTNQPSTNRPSGGLLQDLLGPKK